MKVKLTAVFSSGDEVTYVFSKDESPAETAGLILKSVQHTLGLPNELSNALAQVTHLLPKIEKPVLVITLSKDEITPFIEQLRLDEYYDLTFSDGIKLTQSIQDTP